METEIRQSEKLKGFIQFLEDTKESYESAKKKLGEYDSKERHIYWAHKFEFANNRNERNRLTAEYHHERLERRKYKDICDLYELVYEFINSENNKSTLKRLKGAIQRQEKQEDYLESERTYKRGDSGDTD